jgi:hypothetical protein
MADFLIGLVCGVLIGAELMCYGVRLYARDNSDQKVLNLFRHGKQ